MYPSNVLPFMGSEGFVATRFKHTIQCLLYNYTEGKLENKQNTSQHHVIQLQACFYLLQEYRYAIRTNSHILV